MGDRSGNAAVNDFARYIFMTPPRCTAPRDVALLAMMSRVALAVRR